MSKKRTHKMEKLARIYDDEVLPVWTKPFARMLLRGLTIKEGSQILDVACGTGYVTMEILRRLSKGSRLISIEGSSTMLDVARRKVEKLGSKDVFFRTASAEPRLSFADDVYDLLVCNLGLYEMPDVPRALVDFARVVRPEGELRCTLPLLGTFQEFYDIYREVLIKHDKHEALSRVDDHIARYPTAEDCEAWLKHARLADARVEVEEFSMLFKSSREFFFAPVIEYGPLAMWKELSGQGQEMQDIFWYIKEAIDAYFAGRAFEITVKGACLIGTKREVTDEDVTGRVERVSMPGKDYRTGSGVQVGDDLIESEVPDEAEEHGTSEIDIAEIEEITDIQDVADSDGPAMFDEMAEIDEDDEPPSLERHPPKPQDTD